MTTTLHTDSPIDPALARYLKWIPAAPETAETTPAQPAPTPALEIKPYHYTALRKAAAARADDLRANPNAAAPGWRSVYLVHGFKVADDLVKLGWLQKCINARKHQPRTLRYRITAAGLAVAATLPPLPEYQSLTS
jgi:hypothetical protein